ncbi:MAG: Tm-1-like ATP-binding domain-containing protein [Desulfobacteraceae bacterium]|jgi:uncharacterized protein (UPF0261 family)
MAKTILIVGTLDTKGEEIKYLKEKVSQRGHRVIVLDTGILDKPYFEPDITREEVARTGGASLDKVIGLNDEWKAIEVMTEGALRISNRLSREGDVDGILAIGGSMGSSLGLSVMQGLPMGLPKLLVNASGLSIIRPELAGNDITIMCTISDLWGMNRITKGVLDKASGAISGMVENYSSELIVSVKPMIGVTTVGTAGLRYTPLLKSTLERKGTEVVVFVAALASTESLKKLIEQGEINGLLDLALLEFANCVCNPGACGKGVDRIKAAGDKGIPLVVSPGAVDFFIWPGSPNNIPSKYRNRPVHIHNSLVSLIKTTLDEKIQIAQNVAQDLNRTKGETVIIIPSRGFSEYDKKGGIFYDPDGRLAFIDTLRSCLKPRIESIDLDVHINDPQFAITAAELMDTIMPEKGDLKDN